MFWLVVTVLKPEAGGLAPFDERFLGYSLAETRLYLQDLSSTGRAVYLLELRLLDSVFPVVFALLLGHLAMQLGAALHPWSRLVLVIPAAGYAMMDLGENALVAGLLRAGPQGVTGDMVDLASQFTVTKWVLLAVSVALLLGLWGLNKRTKER